MDEPKPDDNNVGVLYVRSICMVCAGKTFSCHYCNGEGKNYIEAADKTVIRWINNLSNDRRDDILKRIIEKG